MAGPQPIMNIDNGASKWGEETNTQKMIGQAAQYNPATKLGITNDDQPSKRTGAMPTSQQILGSPGSKSGPGMQVGQGKRGFGSSSGIGPAQPQAGHSFASSSLAEHFQHLASLPEASSEIMWYARSLNKGK